MLGEAGGEGRALLVLWASLWDQPPDTHMAIDGCLPPKTSSPNTPPGHTITKINKCNFFLLQMTLSMPCQQGWGWKAG